VEEKSAHGVLLGKPEGKSPIGGPSCRWNDNIKIDLRKWDKGVDSIDLAHDRNRWANLVNAAVNLRVP
jgi:hypothetical protein